MARKDPRPNDGEPAPSVLGDLLRARGFTASAPEPSVPPTPGKSGDTDLSHCDKIILRRERKGRGGKTVTLVNGLSLPAPRLELLARDMRRGLGCGATIEHGTVVLQGDITSRAEEWLRKHGAARVVQAN